MVSATARLCRAACRLERGVHRTLTIEKINPILRGWVNYFRVGHSSRCFGVVKRWVEKKVRQHLMRARGRKGFGWTRWSSEWLYDRLGLFNDYRLRRWSVAKAAPAR